MQMQGLSLDQAPPYKTPLYYYMIGITYLIGFSISLFFYTASIDNRFYYEAIAITHVLTLGFFTHVMFGTLFQMNPVIIAMMIATPINKNALIPKNPNRNNVIVAFAHGDAKRNEMMEGVDAPFL